MADRRVRYVLEVDYEGESVVVKAADDLRQVDDAAKQAEGGLSGLNAGLVNVAAGFSILQGVWGQLGGVVDRVGQAIQFTYETLKEGAALADARGDFEDLAAGIGSTADALENELGAATVGLKTNAQVIGEASELMALNLGLSKDTIVDLAGVSAELDLNWQSVINTINTGNTRGFKEMGLNVQAAKERVEELRDAGMGLNEAFALTIIEQGNEKIGRVGKRSEESAGQIEILEKAVENAQNEFARGDAEAFAGSLATIAGGAPAAAAAMSALSYSAGTFFGELKAGAVNYLLTTTTGQQLLMWMADHQDALAREQYALSLSGDAWGEYWAQVKNAAGEVDGVTEGIVTAAAQGEMAAVAAGEYAAQQEWLARASEWVWEAQNRANVATRESAQAALDGAAATELAGNAAAAWAEYTADATARGGDYFAQITSSGEATWDYAAAVVAAADAAGAGAGPLSELYVQMGLIDQATADAGVAAAQQQVIIENLAAAAASGKVAWEDYLGLIERANEVLAGGYLIDLGPREMPEMEDRGFREQFQETFEQAVNESPAWVVQLEADNQAVLDAVEEARGVVDGFAGPEQVYEAVMDLDIEGVRTKGGEVQAIIDGLPDRKTVTIDLAVNGEELLEQLKAVGAIP